MDLRLAVRSLWRNPGFTILAVLVMALGIGANTAVFSVVDTVLLKPLDYRNPDRIVNLYSGKHGQTSAPDFHDWHDQSASFEAMAYYSADPDVPVMTAKTAEYTRAAAVTPEFFHVFGVEPVMGRGFAPDEEKLNGTGAALIAYGYWKSHFGGDPSAIGRTVRMEGQAFPIVGVMPPGFGFPDKSEIWVPSLPLGETTSRSAHNYLVVGRLRPGVTLERAQAEMRGIASRLAALYPKSNKNKRIEVVRMQDDVAVDLRSTLYLLLGAVGLVLLIACANVANLLLAKATARTREIAIRAAVGAKRSRIVRQLITESSVLALVSGAAGVAFAALGQQALVALAPGDVPRLADTAIDLRVLGFALAASALASLLFGLAPAVAASRVDLSDALKQGGGSSVSGGAGGLRQLLVTAEIALAVVLLVGAGLLLKSFAALHDVDLGFRPEHLLVMGTSVPSSNLADARRAGALYKDLLARGAGLPGVTAIGATRRLPGAVGSWGAYWVDRLDPKGDFSRQPEAVFSVIAPGTFRALGIPVKAGRDFDDSDAYDAPFTAIINQQLAEQSFKGQNPIGRVLYCGFDSDKPMKIVGVVGDIHQKGPAAPAEPEMFMPYLQHPRPSTNLSILVRTAAAPESMAGAMRRLAQGLAPEVPLKFTTMEATLAENVAGPRFRSLLLAVFAGLAVCLAMAGVYGVMAYVVGRQAREIGLRMALGASPRAVMGQVLRQGLSLAAIGLALGGVGAAAASRLLRGMLFQVRPGDPAIYAAAVALLAIAAASACYLPARRATRVDPLAALRQD